jgi:ABC-type antimicrobial peptide transport system permease subunit
MSANKTPQPPRLANRLFEWRCGHAPVEDLRGDLEELFYADLARMPATRAKWKYWLRVLSLVFSYALRKRKQRSLLATNSSVPTLQMIPGYFTIARRNLSKNRLYTVINVLGLSLAIAVCSVILVIVRFESSFDDFHSKADRIYRVNLKYNTPNGIDRTGRNYTPVAQAIRSEVTGLEAVTGVYCWQQYEFAIDNQLYKEQFAFFVEPEYFDVFDVTWITGNRKALARSGEAVVTDAFADKYLGGISKAMGSTFQIEGKQVLTVTGIVKAPPSNTDHPYTLLVSFPTLTTFMPNSMNDWKNVNNSATYVVFRPDTQTENIQAQFKALIGKYFDKEQAAINEFHLMPLDDNHDRNYDFDNFTYDFPVPVMIILSIIAGMISAIACINFINLATAQSLNRVREVGIRKTMGGSRWQLIVQHMSESLVITVVSAVAGIALAKGAMALIKIEFGNWDLQFHFLRDPYTVLFLAGIIIAIAVLAGFYPAFVVSGYRPVWALNTQTGAGKSRGFSLRKFLVVSQFTFAQMLVLITLIMIRQIDIFKDRPMNFDPETVVTFPYLRGYEPQQFQRLAMELRKVPGLDCFSFAHGHTTGADPMEFHAAHQKEAMHKGMINYGDDAFIRAFHIELVAGKNLLAEQPAASAEVLVNESLVKALGIPSPAAAIGTIYAVNDQDLVIRGVMRDFYTRPMSNLVDPFTLQYNPARVTGVVMSISTAQLPATIAGIENAWRATYPDYLCHYEFLDDMLARRFGFFERIFTFLRIGASLAIFIGCLGLYGFISFMALQRTKEIGIRKVLGATVSNIVVMFSKESALLIVIAFIVAAPVGYFLGMLMLIELPERNEPSPGLFITTIAGSLFIALVTIGHRAMTAALQNPSDSLRTN